MAFVALIICSILVYLLGWMITGIQDASQWELWFKLVAVILAFVWAGRTAKRVRESKGG